MTSTMLNATRRLVTLAAACITCCVTSAQQFIDTVFSTGPATGLADPVFLTHAPGDPDRIFVVDRGPVIAANRRAGSIVILDRATGVARPDPFFEITTSGDSERGLIGLAFHPDFQNNGTFFVAYTDLAGDSTIERYTVSASNPDLADLSSGEIVIKVDQPAANHNGGWLGFSPVNGYLYASIGDGGGGGDPFETGQDLTSLLGTILRLDIDGDDFPADPNRNYAIPAGSPFPSLTFPAALPEIWAWGLRNPWRNSFDRDTGDFLIADVGQDRREEINFQPAGDPGGNNYGWDCIEGNLPFETTGCFGDGVEFTPPLLDYEHGGVNGCSITGGYVYRGCAMPEADGLYFYGDFCSGTVWTLDMTDGVAGTPVVQSRLALPGFRLVSFGEDFYGELYSVDIGGTIRKILPDRAVPDIDNNFLADECERCTTADLAGPFGILNSSDVNAFVDAFLGLEPEADLAPPLGILNSTDINAFVSSFLKGCP